MCRSSSDPPAPAETGAEGEQVPDRKRDTRRISISAVPPHGPSEVDGDPGPDLPLELLGGQGLPHQRLEVRVGVEASVGAQRVLPPVEAQRLPATLVGALPGFVDRGFGVDDEAVEVENDGFGAQRFLVR